MNKILSCQQWRLCSQFATRPWLRPVNHSIPLHIEICSAIKQKRLMLDLYIHIFSWQWLTIRYWVDLLITNTVCNWWDRPMLKWWWPVNAGNIAFEGDQQLSTSPASWPPSSSLSSSSCSTCCMIVIMALVMLRA